MTILGDDQMQTSRRTYNRCRIPEKLRNIDLTVYEKNEEVGGVWFLNKYPGLACDIPCKSVQSSSTGTYN